MKINVAFSDYGVKHLALSSLNILLFSYGLKCESRETINSLASSQKDTSEDQSKIS